MKIQELKPRRSRMRYLGKNSVSSFLKIGCNIAWYINLVIICVLLLATALCTIYGPEVFPHIVKEFAFKAPGLKIVIDRELVTMQPPSRSVFVAFFGSAIIFGTVNLIILYQLRKIFANLVKEEPFVKENVLRVKKIGITVFVGAVIQSIVEFLIGLFATKSLTIQGIELVPRLNLNLQIFFAGLGVLILAEIFKQGVEIKEDQNFTI